MDETAMAREKNRFHIPHLKMKFHRAQLLLVTQTLDCNVIFCTIFACDDGRCACARKFSGHCFSGKHFGLPVIMTGVSSVELGGDANVRLFLGSTGSSS